MTTKYRSLPGAIPNGGFISVEVHSDATATLHVQWAGQDGWVNMPHVPIEPLPTDEALTLGRATSALHDIPLYVRLDQGVDWNADWGNLKD